MPKEKKVLKILVEDLDLVIDDLCCYQRTAPNDEVYDDIRNRINQLKMLRNHYVDILKENNLLYILD